jgi:hypothetical protein
VLPCPGLWQEAFAVRQHFMSHDDSLLCSAKAKPESSGARSATARMAAATDIAELLRMNFNALQHSELARASA